MSTPPFDPNDQPRRPHVPGAPTQPPYPGAQYPAQPGPPGQPGGGAPGQPGGGVPGRPAYNPAQPGYNPYGGTGGFGYTYAPPGQYAGWGSRVLASILDSLIALVPLGIGVVAAVGISGSLEHLSDDGTIALTVGYLAFFGIQLWNRLIRQGRTGQSVGKKLVGLKVVAAGTGERIGYGRNFGREVCAVIFNYFCFLNVLWPLWDDKHQTWHDKVASDIVIKL